MKTQRPDGTLELTAPLSESMLVVQPAAPEPTLAQMMQIATQGNNIEILERLVALQERRDAQRAASEYAQSMRACQEEMRPIVRDAENAQSHSRYARLETIDAAIRPIYTRHGFSLTFNTAPPKIDGNLRVICEVLHTGGHSKLYELEGGLDTAGPQGKANKTPIQGMGSSASYLQRYLTKLIFNITLKNEDNDGQGDTGGPLIAGDQEMEIRDMIAGLEWDDATVLRFLEIYDARRISELRTSHYMPIVRQLKGYLQKRRGAR